MQNKKILFTLLQKENIKSFITSHLHEDTHQLALRLRAKENNQDFSSILELTGLYKKAIYKIPLWVSHFCVLTRRSYEQASSQRLAQFKAGCLDYSRVLDLTGGLGVDDWAFASRASEVISLDPDPELHEVVLYNNRQLNLVNIDRRCTNANEFVSAYTGEPFDLIYADPDRRTETARYFTLEDSQPDIPSLLPQLFAIGKRIMVKASPMINIGAVINNPGQVKSVNVVSMDGEVKEVLFIFEKDAGKTEFCAYSLSPEGEEHFCSYRYQKSFGNKTEGKYLLVPDPSIVKAGIAVEYAGETNSSPAVRSGSLAWSDTLPQHYIGRVFEVMNRVEFSKRNINAFLKEHKIKKANVSRRDFRMSVEEIRKMFGIADGGSDYLFFFTALNGATLMVHGVK